MDKYFSYIAVASRSAESSNSYLHTRESYKQAMKILLHADTERNLKSCYNTDNENV